MMRVRRKRAWIFARDASLIVCVDAKEFHLRLHALGSQIHASCVSRKPESGRYGRDIFALVDVPSFILRSASDEFKTLTEGRKE